MYSVHLTQLAFVVFVLGRHDGGHTFVHVQLLMEAGLRYFRILNSLLKNQTEAPVAVKPGLFLNQKPNRWNSGKMHANF